MYPSKSSQKIAQLLRIRAFKVLKLDPIRKKKKKTKKKKKRGRNYGATFGGTVHTAP